MQNAAAPAPWTVPSMTSLLTGMLPSGHGNDAPLRSPRLLEAVTTYAEILRESHGYQTAAFTSGPWIAEGDSILQGFTSGARGYTLQGTEHILAGFAAKRDLDRPFFLLLHTFDAHDPYGPEGHPWPHVPDRPGRRTELDLDAINEPWEITKYFFLDRLAKMDLIERHGTAVHSAVIRYVHGDCMRHPRPELAAELRAGYEAGVRWVDSQVEVAMAQLKAWGMLQNTVLVVTSDHGEAFGEHGILAHGRQLYDELVHIPMVMQGPEPFGGGRTLTGSVGLHDILPTFLDHIGGAPLPRAHGQSFLPLLEGIGSGRPVFGEEILSRENTGEDDDAMLTSVRSSRWKYIITFDRGAGTVLEEAYDLQTDPGEKHDLCRGSGRIDGLPFDPDFCRAVELARDRIWGAAATSGELYQHPYGGGRALVTSKRPAACGG
ncbi:MAG: sulfatase-like hydrolase/transferase [Planctomycetota bacterium]|nr:sulfatase-like hydrolase/transferase [Planctomycetota bacterium]